MKRLTASATARTLAVTGAGWALLSLGNGCGTAGSSAATLDDGGSSSGGSSSGATSSGGSSSGAGTSEDGGKLGDGGGAREAGDPGATSGVNLRTAGNYAILAMSGISTVPTSAITGDLGISPAAASYVTGFSLTSDSTNAFSTSPQVTGKIYASDYSSPTPANLTAAIGDMQLAFTDAAGRAPSFIEVGAGSIGGMTLAPGVYAWSTSLSIPTDVTLAGGATSVWIFQIAKTLTLSSATHVLLTGGALPQNVFWEVAGAVDLGTTAHFEGIVLTQTSATLETGASMNGRLLAQTAVNIAGSTIVQP
jgi:hypothetical protein